MSGVIPALGLIMFGAVFLLLPFGFPVGFTLMGTAMLFALIGHFAGAFDLILLTALPQRLLGLMEIDLLQAIPLFVYLGVIMQRTTLAAELLEAMSGLFGKHAGGLSISTVILGALLAPTTGAVGASVLTLGLLALPAMLNAGYERSLACGVVCSAGTLGTVLPPSIILIVLAELMRGANAEAQIMRGEDVHGALIIKDIYVGMLAPVGILLACYLIYTIAVALLKPATCPPLPAERRKRLPWPRLIVVVFGPLAFIVLLLGSIVTGRIYTVEAAALGAIVATVYAWVRGEKDADRCEHPDIDVLDDERAMHVLAAHDLRFRVCAAHEIGQHDQDDRRREHGAERARAAHDAAGKALFIARIEHRRQREQAQRQHGRTDGAGRRR